MAQQVATAPLPPATGPAELATHALTQPPGQRPFRSPRHTYGALDLGTNNCRLLVARPTGDSFRVIDAFSRIIRLGEGISASGRISDAAIARAVEALGICRDKMTNRGVTRARLIATEAVGYVRRRRRSSSGPGAVMPVGPSRSGKTTNIINGVFEWQHPAILVSLKNDFCRGPNETRV